MTALGWTTPSSYSAANLITGNGASGDMKNLAGDGIAQGPAVDFRGTSTPAPQLVIVELRCRLASAASGSPYVQVWFVKSIDGNSTYEDGTTSAAPARPPDLIIPIGAGTGQQKIQVGPVLVPDAWVKATLQNKSGQALTNVNDENQLSCVTQPEGAA